MFVPLCLAPLISAPYPSSPRPNSKKLERRSASHSRLRPNAVSRSPSFASSESLDSSASVSSVSSMPSSVTSSSSVSTLTRLRLRRRRVRQNQNPDEPRGRSRNSRSSVRTRKPLIAKDINVLDSSTHHTLPDSLAPQVDHHSANTRRHRRHRKQHPDHAYEKSREDRTRRKSIERAQLQPSPAPARPAGADGNSSGHRRHLHRAQSFAQAHAHGHGRGHSHGHIAVRPARASYGHAGLAMHVESSDTLLNHAKRSHHNCKRSRAGQTCPHCHHCTQLRSGHASITPNGPSTTANTMTKDHARKSEDRKHDKRSRAFGTLFLVPNPWTLRSSGSRASGTANDFKESKWSHHHGDSHGRKRTGRFNVR